MHLKETKDLNIGFDQNDLIEFVDVMYATSMQIADIYFKGTDVTLKDAKFTIEVDLEYEYDDVKESPLSTDDFWIQLAQGKVEG